MPTTLSLVLISLAGFVHAASAQTVEGAVAPKDQPLFETILAIETKIPGTLKKNYIKAFAELVAGDLLAIDEEAFHGKADVVKAMEEQKSKGILFTDFDMQNIRFIRLGRQRRDLGL